MKFSKLGFQEAIVLEQQHQVYVFVLSTSSLFGKGNITSTAKSAKRSYPLLRSNKKLKRAGFLGGVSKHFSSMMMFLNV